MLIEFYIHMLVDRNVLDTIAGLEVVKHHWGTETFLSEPLTYRWDKKDVLVECPSSYVNEFNLLTEFESNPICLKLSSSLSSLWFHKANGPAAWQGHAKTIELLKLISDASEKLILILDNVDAEGVDTIKVHNFEELCERMELALIMQDQNRDIVLTMVPC